MSLVSNNVSVSIQKGLVENLARKTDTSRLATFVRKKLTKDAEIQFDAPETSSSFLKLIKDKFSVQDPGLCKKAVVLFQKKAGIPETVFTEDLVLVGTDGTELKMSSELLKLLFDYFATMLSSGCKESKKAGDSFRIAVELKQEALQAFKEYVHRGKFGTLSYEALLELVHFAESTIDETLKDTVGRALIAHFCEESNEPHLDVHILSGYYTQFTEEYLKKKGVKYEPTGSNFSISLSDFLRLFQNKDSNSSKILSVTISTVYLDDADYDLVDLIPSRFRKAIQTIEKVTLTEYTRTMLMHHFPNAALLWNMAELREAVSSNPGDWFAHGCLGAVLLSQNKLVEAEAALRKAIELDDKDSFAHSRLCELLRRQNRLEEAEKEREKAIKMYDESQAKILSNLDKKQQIVRLEQIKNRFQAELKIDRDLEVVKGILSTIDTALRTLSL